MLKLSFVSNVSNSTVEYAAELAYFSYNVKNNELVAFQATVPTLSATLKLVTVDQHIEAIRRGDLLTVQNSDGTGAALPLRAVEVTLTPRRGIAEVSCSGPFITQTNEIWGTLLVPAGSLSDTKTAYGLSMLHPGADTQNSEMFLNVDKKSDLLLGIAWSYPELRNLAVMPFVGGGSGVYDPGTFSSGEGIAMFKNARPGDEDDDVPVYYVAPEDIIDYDISPAQPPVTHLRTSALGGLGPTPQIPPVQVFKRSGTPGSEDIHDNVRAYYVQGKSLCALWVAQEDTAGNIVSQTLYWSDGISQTWIGGTKKRIVGIFEGCYIEEVSNHFQVVDRETGAVLFDDRCGVGSSWDLQTRDIPGTTFYFSKTSDTGADVDCQLFMCPTAAYIAGQEWCIALEKRGSVISRRATSSLHGTPLAGQDVLFGGASRLSHSPGDMLSTVYIWADYTPDVSTAVRFYFMAFRYSVGANSSSVTDFGGWFDYTPTNVTVHKFSLLDYIDLDSTDFFEDAAFLFRVSEIPSGETDPVSRCALYRLVNRASSAYTRRFDRIFFLTEQMAAPTSLASVPMLAVTGDVWTLYESALTGASVLQSGSISAWAGSDITLFSLFKGAFVVENYVGDSVWEVYMQLSPLPFITRKSGELSVSTQIAAGETNVFALKFKVGAVQQTGQFDKDLGRIHLKVASFDYSVDVMHQWTQGHANIQHLQAMAVGAYVKIALDPDNPADVVIGKVVSFSFTYDGIVKAELVAIIVS